MKKDTAGLVGSLINVYDRTTLCERTLKAQARVQVMNT